MATYTKNRDKIVEAAWHLFWQNGFFATSIGEIAVAAGLPKGSIYNYFKSKDDLLVEVLNRLKFQTETELRLKLLEGTIPPEVIVSRMLEHYIEQYSEYGYGRGDPVGCRLSELADARPELAQRIEHLQTAWRAVVAQKIWAWATVRRVPALVERAEELASIIWAALQGVLLQMKIQHSADPLVEAQKTLVPMVAAYVSALATGEVTG